MDIYRIIPIHPNEDMSEEFKEGFFFEDQATADIIMSALDQITPEGAPKIEWKCQIIELISREQALKDFAAVFANKSNPD